MNSVIPRYVNNILTIKVQGQKRILSTKPTTNKIITKTADLSVKDEYLLAEGRVSHKGLAEFFADCGWEGPS